MVMCWYGVQIRVGVHFISIDSAQLPKPVSNPVLSEYNPEEVKIRAVAKASSID